MSKGASKPDLKVVAQPQAFFRELVTGAMEKQRVSAAPETEFYLVNLLNQFVSSAQLNEAPLALMVKEALEQPETEFQRQLFRHIGDVSLYVAGFFQDSLNRKLVDVGYYIDMGGAAYRHVAVRVDDSGPRKTYEELADKFGNFVEVLAEVSDKTTPRTEKDLLRLYDVWVQTGSERAARALKEAGIFPNPTVKKEWQ